MKKLIWYINNVNKFIYHTFSDYPLKPVVESEAPEQFMLIPNSMVIYRIEFQKIFEKYSVSELFDMSNFVLGTYNEPYMFIHLVKKPVKEFKISVYEKPAHLYRDDINDPKAGKMRIPEKYTDDYLDYLESLDEWVKTGVVPKNVNYERKYRKLNISEFNPEVLYTRFYLDYNDETRDVLKEENIKNLSEVAEILTSHYLREPQGYCKALDGIPKYPFIPEKDAIKNLKTTVVLKKGDIVECRGKFFLLNQDTDFDLYAPPGANVIRINGNLSPEYLFIYLRSSIASRIRDVFTIPAGDSAYASSLRIHDFPVVMPKEEDSFYKEKFEKIANPDQRIFRRLDSPVSNHSVSSILKEECIDKIRLNNDALLKEHIEKDLDELDICFANGAYKSVVMLSGSILEAFLIDWVSELDGKDYFSEDLMVSLTDKNGKSYEKSADLIGYIINLENRFGSKWEKQADYAHSIRKMRNLIHAKLCLSRNEEIDKEKCVDLINGLKSIIDSRETLNKLMRNTDDFYGSK